MDPFDGPEQAFLDSQTTMDALSLLREDHREALALFEQFERASSAARDDRRQEIAREICELLTAHAQIEEEIFYPAARAAVAEQDVLDDAEVEHAMLKELIEQVQATDVDEALFDAKLRVLAEYVRHHVGIEEDELFGLIELTDLDLDRLGEELAARRRELLGTSAESSG
jgi:hemerythrin superfamily protein